MGISLESSSRFWNDGGGSSVEMEGILFPKNEPIKILVMVHESLLTSVKVVVKLGVRNEILWCVVENIYLLYKIDELINMT